MCFYNLCMSTELVLRTTAHQNLPSPTGSSMDVYLRTIGQIPVLSAEEEHGLAVRLYEQNDLTAAQQLILANLRFVVHVARGYMGYGLQLGDLVQEGNVGLMKAVRKFDPNVGVRLISFAVHWIKSEIHEYIIRNWRIVKVATTKSQRKLFFNLRSAKQRLGVIHDHEVAAIAKDLNVTTAEVLEMDKRLNSPDVSFDIEVSDDDHNVRSPVEYLAASSAYDPAYQVIETESEEQTQTKLAYALDNLDARSRDIVQRRWMRDGEKDGLVEIGAEYGISAERVRQIESSAMKKLRLALV